VPDFNTFDQTLVVMPDLVKRALHLEKHWIGMDQLPEYMFWPLSGKPYLRYPGSRMFCPAGDE